MRTPSPNQSPRDSDFVSVVSLTQRLTQAGSPEGPLLLRRSAISRPGVAAMVTGCPVLAGRPRVTLIYVDSR